jgi:hypothetical protein
MANNKIDKLIVLGIRVCWCSDVGVYMCGLGWLPTGLSTCLGKKLKYWLISDIQRVTRGWGLISKSMPTLPRVGYESNPRVKKHIHIRICRVEYPTDIRIHGLNCHPYPWLLVMRLYLPGMKTRQTLLTHVSHDKAPRHQTPSRPTTRHVEEVTGSLCKRDEASPCTALNVPRLCLVGTIKLRYKGPRHQSLYNNPWSDPPY